MENKYTAFLIDDDSESLLTPLKDASSKNNFHIIDADSPAKANEILANYSNVIDIILLDLGFSNSDIQGIDFLSELNKLYPEIPVVILTGSDNAEDIRTAVDCIRRGAADYFGKNRLDPYQLFNRITEIVENEKSKTIHRNLIKKTSTGMDSSIVSYKQTYKNEEKHFAYFIYAINDIAIAINDKHEEFLRNKIYVWRKDLLSLLSLLKQDVTISLRFQKDTGKCEHLKIYIIFSVSGPSEELSIENAKQVFNETEILFSNSYISIEDNYSISHLKEKQEIERILFPGNKETQIRFFVKEFSGFNTDDSIEILSRGDITDKIIRTIVPQKDFILSYDRLMNYINSSEYPLYFEMMLQPVNLSIENIANLKSATTSGDNMDYNMKSYFNNEIYKFIENPRQVYKTFIYVYSDGHTIPENINMAIGNDMFLNTSKFKTIEVELNPSEMTIDLLNRIDDENTISDINSFYNTLRLFHPPFPLMAPHKGFEKKEVNEEPVELSDIGPILGKVLNGDNEQVIRISPRDLLKHVYITGQTGTGKSTLLYGMLMERIYSGKGVAIIEPHGDLIKDVYKNIPENRKSDVVYFDPANENNNVFMNILEYDRKRPEQQSYIINELIRVLDDIYDLKSTGGPIFEQYFRNTLQLVMSDPEEQFTIIDVVKVLHDKELRTKLINRCNHKSIKSFWEMASSAYSDAKLENVIPYISSKLNFFSDNHYVKRVVSNKKSTINFPELLNNNKIFLVNLSKGKLGSNNTVFFGRLLFNKLVTAAYSRENIPEQQRKHFTILVDEFQNFVSKDLEAALSEVRKYRVALVLANQTLSQLSPSILTAVIGNAGSHIFFRQGITDVGKIADLYSQNFTPQQVLALPNFSCIVKMLNDNIPLTPFLVKTMSKEELKKYLKTATELDN